MKINTDSRLMGAESICTDLHLNLMIDVVFGDKNSVSMKFKGRNFNELCKISGVSEELTNELIYIVNMRKDMDFYKFALNSRHVTKNYKERLKTIIWMYDILDVDCLDDSEIESFYPLVKMHLTEEQFVSLSSELVDLRIVLDEESKNRNKKVSSGDFKIQEHKISLNENHLLKIEGELLSDLKTKVHDYMNIEATKVVDFQKESVMNEYEEFKNIVDRMNSLKESKFDYEDPHCLDNIIDILLEVSRIFKIRPPQ